MTRVCTGPSCHRRLCTDAGGHGDDFVSLRPCGCLMCPPCAFRLVVNRKFGTPCCSLHKSEVDCVWFVQRDRESNEEVDQVEVLHHDPTLEKDPCRFYERAFKGSTSTIEDAEEKMVLSLSYAHKTENESPTPASISVVLDRDYGPESIDDECNLRRVFGLLHEPIVRSHAEVWKETTFPRMTPSEFCKYMMEEDDSLLLKLMYALATGEMAVPMAKIKSDKGFFSRFLACCVAKEMIQRLDIKKPGPFQMMMGDVLSVIDAPQNTKDFMSKIRISAHRITMERETAKKALQSANDKIKLNPLDAFTLHFDNIGFKGRSRKWTQHTVIQICTIPFEKLKEAGFYTGKLSRVRKSFEEFCQEVRAQSGEEDDEKLALLVAEKIVGIRDGDWKKLTTRVLQTINTAMELPLPSAEDCREFLAVGDGFSHHQIPLNLGINIETSSAQDARKKDRQRPVATVTLNSDIPAAALGKDTPLTKTFYEANNMTLDNVLHEDPNAKKTVAKIADYIEEAAKFSEDYDHVASGGERPVRDMMAAATSDGAPMKRWLDLSAEDIEENGYDQWNEKKARFFFGGLHFQMEFITMRGRLSRGIFSFFGNLWRPTLPQLNWILCISDPREYLMEIPQYLLAHYRTAYDLLDTKGTNTTPLTPVDVHQHMLDRALQYPTCMAVLLDLRLIEISLMIQDAEKSGEHGDVDLFLTTMRFSLALFTVTHAINYAHMVCDFLEWWALSSEADKVFFKRWLYTKISPYGKPIWVDRGVEWTIKHIRMFLGKRARMNQEARMESVLPDIPFRIKAKAELHDLLGFSNYDGWTSSDWNSRTVRLSKVFFSTVTAIHDTNLWGEGALKGKFACENQEFFMHTEEGEEMPMSSSYLGAFGIGQERAIAYYAEHHFLNRGAVSRKEDNVSLKILPTAADTRNVDREKLRDIRLSTDPKKLMPLTKDFPKEKISKELDELRSCLYADIPEFSSNVTRKDLVATLCEFRKLYFTEYPDVYKETVASVEDLELVDTFTTPEDRRQQLQSPIFSLHAGAINNFLD